MEVIRNIFFVYLFINIVEYCLPGKNYRRYVKFYGGLLVIVMLVSPLMQWVTQKDWMGEIQERFSHRQELSAYQYEMAGAGSSGMEAVLAPYKEKITEKIREIVESGGLSFEACEIFIETDGTKANFGKITGLGVQARRKYAAPGQIQIDPVTTDGGGKQYETAVENIKKEISSFYNLELDNINVNMK